MDECISELIKRPVKNVYLQCLDARSTRADLSPAPLKLSVDFWELFEIFADDFFHVHSVGMSLAAFHRFIRVCQLTRKRMSTAGLSRADAEDLYLHLTNQGNNNTGGLMIWRDFHEALLVLYPRLFPRKRPGEGMRMFIDSCLTLARTER